MGSLNYIHPTDLKSQIAWTGLDTLIVTAGVSALQPLMVVAGVKAEGKTFDPPQASVVGIQHTVDVAAAAITGNYVGPLVAAITFVRKFWLFVYRYYNMFCCRFLSYKLPPCPHPFFF